MLKKISYLLFISLWLAISSIHAVAENLQYDYDNSQQIRETTYDDGTDVNYTFDSSENRLTKDITLSGTINNPPSAPSKQSPSNTATDVSLTIDLSWTTSTDPDSGDEVTYDIYFGTSNPPSLIVSGYGSTDYTVNLSHIKTYYWKIAARDNHNATADEGTIWSFTATTDSDHDNIADSVDNCPNNSNPNQADMDTDGIGDVCDNDIDGDGVDNNTPDNCLVIPNGPSQGTCSGGTNAGSLCTIPADCTGGYCSLNQEDTDNDGYGDVCDSDDDGDGVADSVDNCPVVANPDQSDLDNSGIGDVCDDDTDGDGVNDGADNCPSISNPLGPSWYDINGQFYTSGQPDYDLDGIGDSCDTDLDEDGVDNIADNCPITPNGPGKAKCEGGNNAGAICMDDQDCDGGSCTTIPKGTCLGGSNAGAYCEDDQDCTGGYCEVNQGDLKGDGYGDVCTVYHCVTDNVELENAFNSIKTTPEDDIIQLVKSANIYTLSNTLSLTDFDYSKAYSVIIQGGYTKDVQTGECVSRVPDPTNTIIDGNNSYGIYVNNSYNLDLPHWFIVDGVTIQSSPLPLGINENNANITIKNAIITDTTGSPSITLIEGNLNIADNIIKNISSTVRAGLSVNCFSCNGYISRNIIKNNISSSQYSGLFVSNSPGTLHVINNIISDNSTQSQSSALYAYSGGEGSLRIINNTMTKNTVNGNGRAVFLSTGPDSDLELYNNIIWNNTYYEILVSSPDSINSYNNVYDPSKVVGAFVNEEFNLNVDPIFKDASNGDYHLASNSPAIDKGRNNTPSLPSHDFEGNNRIINGIVDIGADEHGTEISVLPNPQRFYVVNLGNYLDQSITITNHGDQDLDIYSIATPSNPFSIITDNCSNQTLLPFANCTIDVRFEPTSSGIFTDSFYIPSSDPDENTVLVSLSGTGNELPVADAGGPYSGTEGQSITLDGSGSSDFEGPISLYEWDIDNDGTYEYSTTLQTQDHTYAQDGIYTIKLRVTDGDDATDEITTTANISDTSPTAYFTGSPTTVPANKPVVFTDSSTGYDQPVTYEWDFDNNGTTDSTLQNPTYVYNIIGNYTVKLKVTDSDGTPDTLIRSNYITVTPAVYDLSILKGGTGSGTVTSSPSGIDCGSDCSETYFESTTVTLSSVPDAGSLFTGWAGGGCNGTGDCIVTMNSDTTITSTFDICANLPVRINTSYYSSLQSAYDSAGNGDYIESQYARFTEDFSLNNTNITVNLVGGYDCNYSAIIGKTRVQGNMTVSGGEAEIENFIIEKSGGAPLSPPEGPSSQDPFMPEILPPTFKIRIPISATSTPLY